MKKLLSLLFTTAFVVNIAYAQNGWVTHKADNRISVRFPSEPREVVRGSYISTNKDTSIACVLTVVDFKEVANLDSATLALVKDTPEFAAKLKEGIKISLPTVTLEDFKSATWKGLTSYSSAGSDPKKIKYYMFMFIAGSKLYSMSTILKNSVDTKTKDYFFSSIIVSN
ncbi:hypothetical protein SAMN05421821_111123 [Mucilaginibacter lappiensis]|uniref:PsbP protein n=1 Tax=Mucilaginibacter lappiensis TaxID=354630 RepID=A0ABR6PNZ8_9SPHI|nr:hypothetical protein [Mucilaginibacter lappiensis]MBB6111313.1 hypothetical protein [Mucilaginibacter lappiensis]SIR75270.1 hypothetical protein SAMN05421821_111123 [Mucilaginibacter lappiensis]